MKKQTKTTISAVAIALLIAVVVVMAIVINNTNSNLNKQIDDLRTEKVLTASDFQQGGIDGDTGKLDAENEYALMTMNYHKVEGVKMEFEKEDTTIQYMVFYYDLDKKFLTETEYLTADYDKTAPEGAVYFRVMVNTDETKPTADNVEALLAPLKITVQKK